MTLNEALQKAYTQRLQVHITLTTPTLTVDIGEIIIQDFTYKLKSSNELYLLYQLDPVKIINVRTREMLFESPTFKLPELFIKNGLEVHTKDHHLKTLETNQKARDYIAYLKGERFML